MLGVGNLSGKAQDRRGQLLCRFKSSVRRVDKIDELLGLDILLFQVQRRRYLYKWRFSPDKCTCLLQKGNFNWHFQNFSHVCCFLKIISLKPSLYERSTFVMTDAIPLHPLFFLAGPVSYSDMRQVDTEKHTRVFSTSFIWCGSPKKWWNLLALI